MTSGSICLDYNVIGSLLTLYFILKWGISDNTPCSCSKGLAGTGPDGGSEGAPQWAEIDPPLGGGGKGEARAHQKLWLHRFTAEITFCFIHFLVVAFQKHHVSVFIQTAVARHHISLPMINAATAWMRSRRVGGSKTTSDSKETRENKDPLTNEWNNKELINCFTNCLIGLHEPEKCGLCLLCSLRLFVSIYLPMH